MSQLLAPTIYQPSNQVNTLSENPSSDTSGPDINRLVEAHLAGDPKAFREIVRRYQPKLLGFIQRMINDRERAEDLVQETFVRVYRHLHRFDPSRKFSTWVYTIASNLARNEIRNRLRSPIVLFQTLEHDENQGNYQGLEFEDHSKRPDRVFGRRHLRKMVARAVAGLSPEHRAVFVMREIQGQSYDAIARATRTHLGTVKSRLNRARRVFAQLIQPLID